MKISVIVTCYNYVTYVEEAIDSVLKQSCQAHEIIIINDGSTDGSTELLDSKYASHPLIRIIHQDNAGQLAAFRTGINASSGDIVSFLDADDIWRTDYLEQLSTVFDQHRNTDIIIANVETFGSVNGETWWPTNKSYTIGCEAIRTVYQHHWNGVPTSGIAVKTNIAKKLMSYPDDMNPEWITRADDILIFGAAIFGACKYLLAQPLVRYRVHGNNNWHGKKLSYYQHCIYRYRLNRVIRHYAQLNHISDDLLKYVHIEFKTHDRPSWKDFRAYAKLCASAPFSWKAITRQWVLMLVYMWRCRRSAN